MIILRRGILAQRIKGRYIKIDNTKEEHARLNDSSSLQEVVLCLLRIYEGGKQLKQGQYVHTHTRVA